MHQLSMFADHQGAASAAPGLTIAFRSGMSRSKDFWAAAAAGAAIGVVAGELATATRLLGIPRFLCAGGELFIDSGAFAELKTGEVPDFDKVLSLYEYLADCVQDGYFDPARLYVVAPDKVGDQLATLDRLTQYASRVRALVDAGCMVIVPIQRGALSAVAMLDQVAAILGTRQFVAGIPSNKEALSLAECATLTHARFHILGRVHMNADQLARLAALATNNPAAVYTADANWMRGHIAEICQMADTERAARRCAPPAGHAQFITPRSAAITAAIQADSVWSGQ